MKTTKQTVSRAKKQAILITGVPGCGKTTLAKTLAKKNKWNYLSLNDIASKPGFYSKIDKKDNAKIANLPKLEREANKIISNSSKSIVVDGHLGADLHLNVNKVIVLRINPTHLQKRLAKRNYNLQKIEQNTTAEALDYCTLASEQNYSKKKIFEIDATCIEKKPLFEKLMLLLQNPKAYSKPKINWSSFILR
ncbi:MAG: AAA family ATPase [Candidatus Micrarchaeia archaeon]